MEQAEIIALIQQELPRLVAQDPSLRDFVLRTVSELYLPRREADIKFDRILEELRRDREEQSRRWEQQERKWEEQVHRWHEQDRKWEEQVHRWHEQDRRWEEQARRWEQQERKWEEQVRRWEQQERKWEEQVRRWHEQDRRWEEQDRRWHEQLAEIRRLDKRFESTIGALSARWGIASETSFRNALAGILTESFGVEVLNLTLYDHEGEVLGRPDQVELDLIIKNGLTIACEIKSSIDKAGMYIFDRKVTFYARHHQRQIDRKIVISPMVDPRARPVAEALGIEIYSYADAVEGL
ncbi:DUF3782 domain-containing protein [Thermosynechococcus sichuanensis E542]|uniref:DUF3782 domain-containing protein n=1 Tax=Thermosynechococcus sichuanensis E542 TaxID=2016101 RepID=A0A3B7MAP3_9CYAN|nr:DUF3782 domain-containing protein [Thermosynechococcus vestitus]AXY67713.1 DUF3782 domain-containing protein [Thermosynechococcus vestitus E542]